VAAGRSTRTVVGGDTLRRCEMLADYPGTPIEQFIIRPRRVGVTLDNPRSVPYLKLAPSEAALVGSEIVCSPRGFESRIRLEIRQM